MTQELETVDCEIVKTILLTLPLGLTNAHAVEQRVRNFVLDDHTVHELPVSGTRVTTINFPSPITPIDAALTTSDGKMPGLFQIAHAKGDALAIVPLRRWVIALWANQLSIVFSRLRQGYGAQGRSRST